MTTNLTVAHPALGQVIFILKYNTVCQTKTLFPILTEKETYTNKVAGLLKI